MFDKKDLNMKRWILPAFALGTFFMAACSDAGKDTAGTSEEAEGITAVTDWEVAGVSQKGPFVTGSAVTVQELDGITLKQTGKSFKGSIKSDKGDFAIKDINLKSQYAILEASGYYRDEISGKKSSAPVTLRALTDLSNRKTVNINLLTHLEYERVSYLLADKKMPIADAKARAESEVFASFAIEGEFAESEDLNIFKTGDGNAALLAVSVLLQSDVDVAGLTERMGEFSIALAEGGSWDDADTKTAIADWACDADLKGSLNTVRKNVENWKYADTVPAFEKYVTNFWWNNYGLGVCNDKRENETKRNVNKLSKLYNEYFVCESGRWHIPGEEPVSSSSSNQDSSGKSFGTMKDSRDGKEYKTVRIGNQVWMAENLNYAAEGSLCYGDDEKNCEKYGRLYDWDIALDTTSEECGKYFYKCTLKSDFYPRQGVCPDGWHLPDKGEWMDLVEYARDNSHEDSVAYSLQSYYWDDDWERQYGTDKFGFNAMPAGMFDGENYVGLDSLTDFWTSSNTETFGVGNMINTVDYVILRKKDSEIWYYGADLGWALSVRCVKGTGKKRGSSDGSSSSVASSSSVYNPFEVISSRDTIPELPTDLNFFDSLVYAPKGYMSFADGKQEVWFLETSDFLMAMTRDSLASELVKVVGENGFSFEDAVLNDSLSWIYNDTSYVYKRTDNDRVYKIAITKVDDGGAILCYYRFDVKIVVLKDGFEELPTTDRNSLRYESELPAELSFVNEYVSERRLSSWSDDSLMTFWYARHTVDSVRVTGSGSFVLDPEKEKAAGNELNLLTDALVENGFTMTKSDSIGAGTFNMMNGYTRNVTTSDTLVRRSYYEKETSIAKYSMIVYVGLDDKLYSMIERGYMYGYSMEIRTYYKNKPE